MRQNKDIKNKNHVFYCVFGAETILGILQTLEAHLQGARTGQDPEDVHQMRVYSRRISAALSIFSHCFPKKKHKIWVKEIKKSAQALNTARDLDVQALIVENFIKGLEDDSAKKGVMMIIEKNREERVRIQDNVNRSLEEMASRGVMDELKQECMKVIKERGKSCLNTSPATAGLSVMNKVEELMSYEKAVYNKKDILEHHKMRIAAKNLRYSLEILQKLFEEQAKCEVAGINKINDAVEMSEQIAEVKKLQDVLGEKHDFDVLIKYTSSYANALKSQMLKEKDGEIRYNEAKRGMDVFREYLKKRSIEEYSKLVFLWNEAKEKDIFSAIKKSSNPIKFQQENRGKKIAVISDIHGNLEALRAVMKDADMHGADFYINAGDIIGYGPFPDESVKALMSVYALGVSGNFDVKVLDRIKKNTDKDKDKDAILIFNAENISNTSYKYIKFLPEELHINAGEKTMLIVHQLEDAGNRNQEVKQKDKADKAYKADIIISGHSHIQSHTRKYGTHYINPGSVGKPEDGDSRAMYAILHLEPLKVEMRRVKYDTEGVAEDMRRKGLPESCVQSILRAMPFNELLEDEKKIQSGKRNLLRVVYAASKVKNKYWPDSGHEEQVRALALKIFSDLSGLHNMGYEEKILLECACMLHDIGWAYGKKGHHRSSMRMVLNEPNLPITGEERYIIAGICRYHRKRFPAEKDYNLKNLSQKKKRTVIMLSAIMRLADGLDASHTSAVKSIDSKISNRRIVIECISQGNAQVEKQIAESKKDLLEKVSGKKVAIVWIQ